MMYAPNILVTNHCNQNCSFCFARKEMDRRFKKEMPLEDLEKVYRKTRRMGRYTTVKLLGGEPTLHSRFEDMIRLSLRYFSSVQIFTNGMFSAEKAVFLNTVADQVKYSFNLATPGFLLNKSVRKLVLERMGAVHPKSSISIAVTIDPFTDLTLLTQGIPEHLLKRISSVRIGLSNPIAGENNTYGFRDFPLVGKVLVSLIKIVRKKGFRGKVLLNCGLTRCMFTDEQYRFITKEVSMNYFGFGCFGKQSSMDIGVDGDAFHCFPLSTEKRYNVKTKSLPDISRRLLGERLLLWKQYELDVCRKCKFFGYGTGKCPGPCIALRINQIKQS